LPTWYILHIFYGGLQEENRTTLDLAAWGAFMDCTITKAWAILDKMRRNRESWFRDLGSEGGIEIDYDCIHAFNKTGKVDKLAIDLYLDSNIVQHVIKDFTEHKKDPKKDWLCFPKPKLESVPKSQAIIAAPFEPLK
jgi:hypothetical protein